MFWKLHWSKMTYLRWKWKIIDGIMYWRNWKAFHNYRIYIQITNLLAFVYFMACLVANKTFAWFITNNEYKCYIFTDYEWKTALKWMKIFLKLTWLPHQYCHVVKIKGHKQQCFLAVLWDTDQLTSVLAPWSVSFCGLVTANVTLYWGFLTQL